MDAIEIGLDMLVNWSTWAIMLWVDVADTDGVPVEISALPGAYETEPTKVDPITTAQLPRRSASTLIVAAAIGAFVSLVGCATARPIAEAPETVGNLAASYHSIAVAPVHASTDLTPAFGAVDTDEAPVTVAAPIEKAEAPEIAPKTDGITTGTVR